MERFDVQISYFTYQLSQQILSLNQGVCLVSLNNSYAIIRNTIIMNKHEAELFEIYNLLDQKTIAIQILIIFRMQFHLIYVSSLL